MLLVNSKSPEESLACVALVRLHAVMLRPAEIIKYSVLWTLSRDLSTK